MVLRVKCCGSPKRGLGYNLTFRFFEYMGLGFLVLWLWGVRFRAEGARFRSWLGLRLQHV